eukprot:m.214522 g.214522  ORF g.214522 m.214522 type:complete len:426 (+) comp25583_c0_seq1:140-1417(+)
MDQMQNRQVERPSGPREAAYAAAKRRDEAARAQRVRGAEGDAQGSGAPCPLESTRQNAPPTPVDPGHPAHVPSRRHHGRTPPRRSRPQPTPTTTTTSPTTSSTATTATSSRPVSHRVPHGSSRPRTARQSAARDAGTASVHTAGKRRKSSRPTTPVSTGHSDVSVLAMALQQQLEQETRDAYSFAPWGAAAAAAHSTEDDYAVAAAMATASVLQSDDWPSDWPPADSPSPRRRRPKAAQAGSAHDAHACAADARMARELARGFEAEAIAADRHLADQLSHEARRDRHDGAGGRGGRSHQRTGGRRGGRRERASHRAPPPEQYYDSATEPEFGGGGRSAEISDLNLSALEDVVVCLSSDQLRTRTVGGTQGTEEAQEPCTICMDPIAPGERTRRLPCLDLFHDHCVSKWLAQSTACPVCRTDVRAD